jgi:hypothetical protein
MATFTADRVSTDFPVFKSSGAGILCRAWGTIAIAANPTAADIYQFCRVPTGAVVTGGWVIGEDIDTNATETLDMDVGWAANGIEAANPDGFGNFGVLVGDVLVEYKAEEGILLPFQGVLASLGPQTFSAETIIEMVCNVTAATFAGPKQLSVYVDYVNP